jgi:serine/alanine adding enzyme
MVTRPYDQIPEWDQFVTDHARGSVYHLSSYIRCEAQTKKHFPFARGAFNAQGKLCAILVGVEVRTLGSFASRFAARSIMYTEPLSDGTDEGYAGLRELVTEHDAFMQNRVLFTEVRPLFPLISEESDVLQAEAYVPAGYINYEVRIDLPEEELFHRLGAKRRNNVRSSLKKGVTVEERTTTEGTDQLYELLKLTYEKSRVPLVDKSLFDSIVSALGRDKYRILIATWQNEPLAGGCFLTFKDRVICWYAGTKRIAGLAGTTCVFWEAMKTYSAQGYRVFDLAGGGWEGEDYGPGKFKSRFGGERQTGVRYRKVYSPTRLRLAEFFYSALRRWL